MFDIQLRAEIRTAFWRNLPEEMREAIREKTIDQTLVLYRKVMENVTGKVINQKSGQLADSIKAHSHQDGNDYIGFVGPEPATAKAYALEYGGKNYYFIYPSVKEKLHFFWEKKGVEVWFDWVHHPPMKEYAYLRNALNELNLEAGYTEALDQVLSRGR